MSLGKTKLNKSTKKAGIHVASVCFIFSLITLYNIHIHVYTYSTEVRYTYTQGTQNAKQIDVSHGQSPCSGQS